jgi:hypothetical protein
MAGQVLLSSDGVTLVDHQGTPIVVAGGGGGAPSFPIAATGATAATDVITTKVTGDSQNRWVLNHDGSMEWGPGNAPANFTLGYNGSGFLETTGAIKIGAIYTQTLGIFGSWSFAASLGTLNGLATGAGVIPIVARGAASQSANLQEWQSSAGTAVAAVGSTGIMHGVYFANTFGANNTFVGHGTSNPNNLLGSGNAGYVILRVQNAIAQTANMQEWANTSGVAIMSVKPDGSIHWHTGAGASKGYIDNFSATGMRIDSEGGITRIYGGADAASEALSVFAFGSKVAYMTRDIPLTLEAISATSKPLVAKGAASQTANLQEWQDSGGAILAKVAFNGSITSPAVTGGLFGLQSTSGAYYPSTGSSYMLALNATPNTLLQAANAAHIPLVVKGAASQSAALQEWQSSGGTAVASIDANGSLIGSEKTVAHGNTGATEAIDFSAGTIHTAAQDQACTYSFTGAVSGCTYSATLILTSVTGAATWPASVKWADATAPTLSAVTIITFLTTDGGTTIYGFPGGKAFA